MDSLSSTLDANGVKGYFIKEDSIFRKAAGSIPMLGVVVTLFNEYSLATKISDLKDSKKIIRLIEVKNHYKISSIIRELLVIAVILTLIATGILHGTIPLAIGGVAVTVLIGVLALHGYRIHHNRQIEESLKNDKVTANMRVL